MANERRASECDALLGPEVCLEVDRMTFMLPVCMLGRRIGRLGFAEAELVAAFASGLT